MDGDDGGDARLSDDDEGDVGGNQISDFSSNDL